MHRSACSLSTALQLCKLATHRPGLRPSRCSHLAEQLRRRATGMAATPQAEEPAAAAAAGEGQAAAQQQQQQQGPEAPKFSAALTDLDASKYEEQLQAKMDRVGRQFAEFAPPQPQLYRSRPSHYRMRTEFKVWHQGDDTYYVMYEQRAEEEKQQQQGGRPKTVRVDQFDVASELVNELMPILMEHVRATPVLRRKLFQANFHTTLSGEAMVTLVYHRRLEEGWREAAEALREALAAAPSSRSRPHVLGRSKGQLVALDASEVREVLQVDGQQLQYVQLEGSFSQPNAGVCQHMLSWARSVTAGSTDRDLLELYCGNGNFTVALAPNFRQVVATEVSKSGVAAAKRNFDLNGVTNAHVARVSSEDFTAAWKEGRSMHRLAEIDMGSLQLRTLLVDPPRAGLDPQTVQLLRDFDSVIYISCNPDTLHANLLEVKDEFEITRMALFDQFPYTHHCELGVYLQRRQPAAAAAAAAAVAAAAAAAAADPGDEEAAQDDGAIGRGTKRKELPDAE